MKKKVTLALASSILTLTLSAFPHHAAASPTTAPPADSEALRKAGGSNLIYLQYLQLLSALLP